MHNLYLHVPLHSHIPAPIRGTPSGGSLPGESRKKAWIWSNSSTESGTVGVNWFEWRASWRKVDSLLNCGRTAPVSLFESRSKILGRLPSHWFSDSIRDFKEDSLHRTTPHHIALNRTAPYRTAPHHTALHHTAPHRTAPHRTAPHRMNHTAAHRTTPHHTTRHWKHHNVSHAPFTPRRTAPHHTALHQPHRIPLHRTTTPNCTTPPHSKNVWLQMRAITK